MKPHDSGRFDGLPTVGAQLHPPPIRKESTMNTDALLSLAQTSCPVWAVCERDTDQWTMRTVGGVNLSCRRSTGAWLRHMPWRGWESISADEAAELLKA
nr:MAG TPA: hypothetical protein [Caudoviricetes sp.]